MNSLSLILYLADVFGSLKVLLWVATPIITVALMLLLAASIDPPRSMREVKFRLRWFLLPAACAFIACIIPSQNTVYLIAGSEAGEMAVKSETGQEILNEVKLAIQQQIKELQK
jgi:hypothetical protein